MTLEILHGDCIEVLKGLPDNSVDSVVTDPPYGLSALTASQIADVMVKWATGERDYMPMSKGFMGKSWDGFVPPPAMWDEAFRVLKPGGHLLAFAGTRTQDLMGLSIRLSGFEIRDNLAWMYGSGFPKSLDVSKAIDKAAGATREPGVPGPYSARRPRQEVTAVNAYSDGVGDYGSSLVTAPATPAAQQWQGWGTALKPAFEPVVCARKPLAAGTVAANVLRWGTGALNIDASRIGTTDTWAPSTRGASDSIGTFKTGIRTTEQNPGGRWPANVILDEHSAALLDGQSGTLKPGKFPAKQNSHEASSYSVAKRKIAPARNMDSGGASRFFKVIKEAECGLTLEWPFAAEDGGKCNREEGHPGDCIEDSSPAPFRYVAKAPKSERPTVDGVSHETVKPLALMRYLVKLVTPTGGTVLEPFAGSGTTVEACLLEGFGVIAIEREAKYLPLIQARVDRVILADMEDLI